MQRVESGCRVNVSPSPECVRVQSLDSSDNPTGRAFLESRVLTRFVLVARAAQEPAWVTCCWTAMPLEPAAAVGSGITEMPMAATNKTQKPAAAASWRRPLNMILRRVGRSGEGLDPSIELCSWPVLELFDMTGVAPVVPSQGAVAS